MTEPPIPQCWPLKFPLNVQSQAEPNPAVPTGAVIWGMQIALVLGSNPKWKLASSCPRLGVKTGIQDGWRSIRHLSLKYGFTNVSNWFKIHTNSMLHYIAYWCWGVLWKYWKICLCPGSLFLHNREETELCMNQEWNRTTAVESLTKELAHGYTFVYLKWHVLMIWGLQRAFFFSCVA